MENKRYMKERPILNKELDSKTFLSFYFLKEELIDFCRMNNLPTTGGKIEIMNMIAHYLDTNEILEVKKIKKRKSGITNISENSQIEENFVCSEINRAFFKEHIGKSFSFNVTFQNWLKCNAGKTYKDAISAYYQIKEDNKKGNKKIEKQFEYNSYIRDFFSDNKDKSLDDAIKCWNYKKQYQGHNRYEKTDLKVLEKQLKL